MELQKLRIRLQTTVLLLFLNILSHILAYPSVIDEGFDGFDVDLNSLAKPEVHLLPLLRV